MTPLFDWAEHARKSDKQTSKEGAKHAERVSAVRRSQFIDALEKIGGSGTAKEVASLACGGDIALHDSIRRRATDLVRDEVIEEVGVKICSVSHKKATVYGFKKQERVDLTGLTIP